MKQLFTREEANRLLPRLISVIGELQERKRHLDARQAELMALYRRTAGNGHGIDEAQLAAQQTETDQLFQQLNEDIERINALGCELKDIDSGLVDFPSLREGREVYLCWRVGEPEVMFWHELNAGFAGRQPL